MSIGNLNYVVVLSFNDIIFKSVVNYKRSKRINSFFLVQVGFIFLSCLVAHFIFKQHLMFDFKSIGYGIIIGILAVASYKQIFKCLDCEDAAYNVTVYRLNFIIATSLSIIILGELLTFNKFLGILLCIAAVLFFTNFKKGGIFLNTPGLKYSIAACFLNGIINFITKVALNNGIEVFTIIFYRFSTMFLVLLFIFAVKKEKIILDKKIGKISILSGMIMIIELYLFYTALRIGEVIIITPITQLSFVISSVLLFVFLHEKFGVKKIAGICFAIAAIVVISLG